MAATMDLADYDAVVSDIYDAALDPENLIPRLTPELQSQVPQRMKIERDGETLVVTRPTERGEDLLGDVYLAAELVGRGRPPRLVLRVLLRAKRLTGDVEGGGEPHARRDPLRSRAARHPRYQRHARLRAHGSYGTEQFRHAVSDGAGRSRPTGG